jgi:hypothetical protein
MTETGTARQNPPCRCCRSVSSACRTAAAKSRHFEQRTGKDSVRARRMAGRCGAPGRAPIYPKYGSQPETADAPSPSRPMSDCLARLAGRDQVPEGSGSDRRQDGGNLGARVGQVARFAQPRRQIGAKASPRHRSIVSQGGNESRPMRSSGTAALPCAASHTALIPVALQRGAYLAQGAVIGGLSHAKTGRDARRCRPGGDDAHHPRYRDGFSAQPHGVGQGGRKWPTADRPISGALAILVAVPWAGGPGIP